MLTLIFKMFLSIAISVLLFSVTIILIWWLLIASSFICRLIGLTRLSTFLAKCELAYITRVKSSIAFLFRSRS